MWNMGVYFLDIFGMRFIMDLHIFQEYLTEDRMLAKIQLMTIKTIQYEFISLSWILSNSRGCNSNLYYLMSHDLNK